VDLLMHAMEASGPIEEDRLVAGGRIVLLL